TTEPSTVQGELDDIADAMGLDPADYILSAPIAGTEYTADEEAGLAQDITSLVNQMITEFNAANPGDTELALDDTKLQTYLENELGVDSGVAATIDSNSTLDELAT